MHSPLSTPLKAQPRAIAAWRGPPDFPS